MDATLSIGEVAAATGLRPSALRYYEGVDLIRPAARVGGRRHYRPDVIYRLAFVALAQDAGFTVAEIRTLLGGHARHKERWRAIAERKLTEIDAQLENLRVMRRVLQEAAECGCSADEICELVAKAGERRARAATGSASAS